MHVVIFGLTVSSSWGNGHATLWRSLIKAMIRRGHTVVFYEKDVSFYAGARDLHYLPDGGVLRLYTDLDEIRPEVQRALNDADLALCTSFCPDGPAASDLILNSRAGVKAFYDLDTPVTLSTLSAGGMVSYLPQQGLYDFDVVLSYTGGEALTELQSRLGARAVATLYGSVDPDHYRPVTPEATFRSTLSYLGTYADDRQESLQRLFLDPARMMPGERFLIGGAQYPADFPWLQNVAFSRHVEPPVHPVFFSSSRVTLNVTRRVMANYGYCPSGRLFEAAACGTPLLTDAWEGLSDFFTPGSEILQVATAEEVVDAITLPGEELRLMANRARERTLAEHTGERRVQELELICEATLSGSPMRLETV